MKPESPPPGAAEKFLAIGGGPCICIELAAALGEKDVFKLRSPRALLKSGLGVPVIYDILGACSFFSSSGPYIDKLKSNWLPPYLLP